VGAGQTTDAIQIDEGGDLFVNLRAERSGGGDDRVCTIHVECVDALGNTSPGMVDVVVPPDNGGKKK